MNRSSTLVFTTCYNERDNIGPLIDQITSYVPEADILVVDDNSPDGTWEVITSCLSAHRNLYAVKRPGKLGIGSAHKYALLYAMRENYETLVTMDADFSHNPRSIPDLLRAHGKNTFVTGSRYCLGGSSDYKGYRNIVSRLGNILARFVLGVKLKELTTYFRVFDVDCLRRLPLRHVSASGYSYGVELIYHLRKAGVILKEVPIHFVDRTRGASKIPKWQVVKSALDLFILGLRRVNLLRDLRPDVLVNDPCGSCGDRVLAMKHLGSTSKADVDNGTNGQESSAYRCTAVGRREFPPVYTCLNCGLDQVPRSLFPPSLEETYEHVVDPEYLNNVPARRKTYRRCLKDIRPFIPPRGIRLLEVGSYCGIFLQEAKACGWDAVGVEPSVWASAYARDVSKVDVVQGFLSNAIQDLRAPYDVVVSWDVFEHVQEPHTFLLECSSQLSADGLLCLSTLDVQTWLPRMLGTRWPWLINMHLFYFGDRSIRNVFARAGLKVLSVKPYVHYARIRYMINGGSRVLPGWMAPSIRFIAKIIPESLIVPVSFGDIKMYVLQKTESSGMQ